MAYSDCALLSLQLAALTVPDLIAQAEGRLDIVENGDPETTRITQ